MKARRAAWLVVLFAWLAAAASAAAEPSSLKSLQELSRRGRYEACRVQAEAALAEHPDDPWLTLYRNLCAERLGIAAEFPPMFSEQLHQRMEELAREEQAQRRHAVQQKALDRELKQEQQRWDREVQSLARDVERERLRDAREAAQAEARRRRLSRHDPRPLPESLPETVPPEPALPPQTSQVRPGERRVTEPARPPGPPVAGAGAGGSSDGRAGEPEEPDGSPVAEAPPSRGLPPAPALPSPPRAERGAPGSVAGGEVAPVRVQVPTPSLVGKPKPPAGAVQINARQMGMSPDSKVATAEGDVELVYGEAFLTCDRMTLFTDTHNVYAEGHVRLEQGAQVFRGEMVQYNFDTKKGRFLQGTVSNPPWVEHGRALEHIAEGVYEVTPGYLTTCEFEPPHFRLAGRRALVFAEDRHARASNVALIVEQLPFLYLPFVSFTEHRSPFFIVPGKSKLWGPFVLGGYRYQLPGEGDHHGAARLDWRKNFGWGYGLDHQFESTAAGKGLLKVYFNPHRNKLEIRDALPKGADEDRYRLMWRHAWRPVANTSVVTDVQEFSDANYRKDFLYREEYLDDDQVDSYISSVTSTQDFSFTGLVQKRMNRFDSATEALPQLTLNLRERPIGDTNFYTETTLDAANLQSKTANSDQDTDVVRGDMLQQFKYAARFFSPVEVTPRVGTRQTYYREDIRAGGREGHDNVIAGQFFTGVDSSLKLLRVFPVATNAWGLNINRLRHVLTPSVGYTYRHGPTIPNEFLNFPSAEAPSNALTFGLENKLQTKRLDPERRWHSVDLARLVTSLPYTFHGAGNEQGARFGDWSFDLETTPWPWMRLESDVAVPSHFDPQARDARITAWNTDLVAVGGAGMLDAGRAHKLAAPQPVGFQPGPTSNQLGFLPQGQWYLGLGHRYSQNDKTESVLQWDWRLSEKWQIGTFHRYTFKEVVGAQKRFNNLREVQYNLRRDLHDWVGELVYRVDREYGEELFFTLTLKAFPEMPIEMETAYHQPKLGSQSSVFSPVQ